MNQLEAIQEKVCDLDRAKRKIQEWNARNLNVVFTNGCFDILHKGHLTYLAKAAELGDKLIIGINSDSSVRSLGKGEERPINAELDRAFLIAGLGIVDAVVVFDDHTPKNLIEELQPNTLVKGGDYHAEIEDENDPKYIVGRETIMKNGGQVLTIPLVEGYSTTSIVRKLNS